MNSKNDENVRHQQVQHGAEQMAVALRSSNKPEGEALAKIVEAIAQIVREEAV